MSMTTASGLPLETLASDIKARVAAGDRDAKRSEDHYRAAGIQLVEAQARVRAELPGTAWLTWVATNLPDIKERRVQQLMQIGRGETTQADLNAASNASRRWSFEEADEFIRNWPGPDARKNASDEKTAALARDAERQRQNCAKRNEARVAAGGRPSRPRKAPKPEPKPEHKPAPAPMPPAEPEQTAFVRLCSAWTDATEDERSRFMEWTPETGPSPALEGHRAKMRSDMRKRRSADRAPVVTVMAEPDADIFARDFKTERNAQIAATGEGLMADEFDVLTFDNGGKEIDRVVRKTKEAA